MPKKNKKKRIIRMNHKGEATNINENEISKIKKNINLKQDFNVEYSDYCKNLFVLLDDFKKKQQSNGKSYGLMNQQNIPYDEKVNMKDYVLMIKNAFLNTMSKFFTDYSFGKINKIILIQR